MASRQRRNSARTATKYIGLKDDGPLVMHHPARFDQFLEQMQELAVRHGSPEERAALAARFDIIPAPASATPRASH